MGPTKNVSTPCRCRAKRSDTPDNEALYNTPERSLTPTAERSVTPLPARSGLLPPPIMVSPTNSLHRGRFRHSPVMVKKRAHKTNISFNRATHKIQGYNITFTTTHVQDAIKQGKNNNSQGPAKLNIRHLKHIGPLGLLFLTSMLKTALNTNIWKFANIIPIPKPNKDID